MAGDAASLRRELKALRRDEGRTLVKLLASPALRDALGNPDERQLLASFDGAVLSLGADLRSLALKNAYGIGLRDPGILTTRRERFGAQPEVSRGPDTVNNWEDEKIEELVARLVAGAGLPAHAHHMIAVAVQEGAILVVTEGEAESGTPMRSQFNPNREPFLPGYIYQLPAHLHPGRLTMSVFFMDEPPGTVYAAAAGELLMVLCGEGRQELRLVPGGIPGMEAAAYASVHWDEPAHGVWFGVAWHN